MNSPEEKSYEIETVQQGTDGKTYYYRSSSQKTGAGISWKTKLTLAGLLIGGIVVGTLLFLFFLTLFIYVFLPLAFIFLIWEMFRRWTFR